MANPHHRNSTETCSDTVPCVSADGKHGRRKCTTILCCCHVFVKESDGSVTQRFRDVLSALPFSFVRRSFLKIHSTFFRISSLFFGVGPMSYPCSASKTERARFLIRSPLTEVFRRTCFPFEILDSSNGLCCDRALTEL